MSANYVTSDCYGIIELLLLYSCYEVNDIKMRFQRTRNVTHSRPLVIQISRSFLILKLKVLTVNSRFVLS